MAQPDCDVDWLQGVSAEEVAGMVSDNSLPPLEVRRCMFCCGCTPEKIAAAIGGAVCGRLEEIYGQDAHINVDCPRCGLRHELPRELFN